MKKTNLRIKGYKGTWEVVATTITSAGRADRAGARYYLLQSERWGDEAGAILTDENLNPLYDTWDDIRTAVDDYLTGLEEGLL